MIDVDKSWNSGFVQAVQDEKDKEYLARKPVVNSDEVEGVSYVLEAYLYQNIILIICNFLDEGKCSIKALVG